MLYELDTMLIAAKNRILGYFDRLRNDELGGAELIATIVIVAVVLVLALAFRKNLTNLVTSLWDNLVKDQSTGAPEITGWE